MKVIKINDISNDENSLKLEDGREIKYTMVSSNSSSSYWTTVYYHILNADEFTPKEIHDAFEQSFGNFITKVSEFHKQCDEGSDIIWVTYYRD